jgi:hypothetical protein
MTTPRETLRLILTALVLTGVVGATLAPLGGCEEEKKEAPPPPPPPPPPVDTDALLASMQPDRRVQFPRAFAPTSEGLARAVVNFADALAKGDAARFASMLAPPSQPVLDRLRDTGQWDEAVARIEAVRVVAPVAPLGSARGMGGPAANAPIVIFAVQEPGAAYLLAWVAMGAEDAWTFVAVPVGGLTRPRAIDFDVQGDPTALLMLSGLTDGPDGMPAPNLPGAAPGDVPAPSAPAVPPPEENERRIRTPRGPVDVPTGPREQPQPG